ncbi:MAG: hypothetical protein QNJ06_21155 [Kiloniellales bacterium]|nr:hypothetical protein [Kiloniellales bacterium]
MSQSRSSQSGRISTTDLTEAEILSRRPVWIAMSELWLDTELQDQDLDRIARALHDSGYDRDTLDRILAEEVAPVVYRNLYSVAGVWTGFDPDWLCAEISRRLPAGGPIRTWLLRRRRAVMRGLIRDEWQAVLCRYDALADARHDLR